MNLKLSLSKLSISCAVVVLLLAPLAFSQIAPGERGRRTYEEQLRVQLDEQIPEITEMGFEAGGWFNFAFLTYDDKSANKVRTLRDYELRGWANVNIHNVHRLYVRGLVGYEDWNTDDNPDDETSDDFTEPKIERAWYEFNLAELCRQRTGELPGWDFKFKVGRAFAEIGTALVLSMPLDMLQWDLSVGDWDFMALLGQTLPNTINIDDSTPVEDQQDRGFFGVELAYNGCDQHRPFVYFLNNQDNTSPHPDDPLQKYEYTSRYVGAGSEGSLFCPDFHYQTEIVGEWGKTYSEGTAARRDKIEAMALDVLLEYYFRCKTNPKVMVEYLYASGDSDRRLSATSTIGGNLNGTKDHAFNAFGFRDLGIAFAPRFSNLNVYIVGGSLFPFEDCKPFKQMEIGSKVFFYHKATGSGPISDTTSTRNSKFVGWEWDLFCDWRITSDLTYTIRYGAFQPGDAFGSNETRHFLYTGLTFSF